jgi:hypothetical protein
MVTLRCHGCGREAKAEKLPKEFICKVCGAVNVVPQNAESAIDAAGCLPPKSFEWTLPAGFKEGPAGKIFVTAQGSEMTKQEYIEAFGIDPEIALIWMKKMRSEGKSGFTKIGGKK